MRHKGRVSTTTSPGMRRAAGSTTGSEVRGVEGVADALDAQPSAEACQAAGGERAQPRACDALHSAGEPGPLAAMRARLERCDAADQVADPPHVDAPVVHRALGMGEV